MLVLMIERRQDLKLRLQDEIFKPSRHKQAKLIGVYLRVSDSVERLTSELKGRDNELGVAEEYLQKLQNNDTIHALFENCMNEGQISEEEYGDIRYHIKPKLAESNLGGVKKGLERINLITYSAKMDMEKRR